METISQIAGLKDLYLELASFIHERINFVENNQQEIPGLGLYNGKTGAIILYFTLFRYTGKKLWEEKARSLLDDISERIASVQELNYSRGLAGIGWTIEWIKQSGYMEINTDEVLEDIDDILYKAVLYARDTTISLSTGTLGKAAYFLKRYESKNTGTHRYKTISHQECLVLLTDEIHEAVAGEKGLLHQFDSGIILTKEQLLDLSHTIIYLSKISHHKINAEIVERTLYALIKYAASLLNKFSGEGKVADCSTEGAEELIYLAYAYYIAGFKLEYESWQQKGQKYFDKALEKVLPIVPYEDTLHFVPMLCCLYHHTEEKYYLQKLMEICRLTDQSSVPLDLQGGIGEMMIGAISCVCPDVISWDEVLLHS